VEKSFSAVSIYFSALGLRALPAVEVKPFAWSHRRVQSVLFVAGDQMFEARLAAKQSQSRGERNVLNFQPHETRLAAITRWGPCVSDRLQEKLLSEVKEQLFLVPESFDVSFSRFHPIIRFSLKSERRVTW